MSWQAQGDSIGRPSWAEPGVLRHPELQGTEEGAMVAAEPLNTVKVRDLDPYAFFAFLGKRVVHPGGRRAS
jgi:hypothetical protein